MLSGSLAVAVRVTRSFSSTLWNGPASTVGGSLMPSTLTTTESLTSPRPSETVSSKVMSSTPSVCGATKVGVGLFGSDSVTAGPPVWTQV